MIGKPLKWCDFKYVAKFSEFWTALAVMAVAAFLLGLAAIGEAGQSLEGLRCFLGPRNVIHKVPHFEEVSDVWEGAAGSIFGVGRPASGLEGGLPAA